MKKNIILFMLILFALPAFAQKEGQVIDKVVAVVGKNIVLQSDVENQYLQYRLQGGATGSAHAMRCQILETLLFQKLMLNQAEMDSIVVSDDKVEAELDRRIGDYMNQFGSQEKMEEMFNKTLPEIKNELRRYLKDRMIEDQVMNGIVSGVEVTPSEVRSFFANLPTDSIPMVSPEYEIVQIVKRPPVSIDEKLEVKDRLYQIRKRILEGESLALSVKASLPRLSKMWRSTSVMGRSQR